MNIVESNELPIYVNQENQAFLYFPDKKYYILRRGTLEEFKKHQCKIQDNELMYIQDLRKLAIKHEDDFHIIPTRIIEVDKSLTRLWNPQAGVKRGNLKEPVEDMLT